MCQEGSYIEDAEADSVEFVSKGGKILFLTSDELKTEKGKKLVTGGVHLQGHSAVKTYFGVKPGTGVEKEADLTDPDLTPAPIADAVRKGKFVGVFYKTDLLSDKGREQFEKAAEKINDSGKEPKGGKFYALTKVFWEIFRASAKNRTEAWA